MRRILFFLAAVLMLPACSKLDREDDLRGDELSPAVYIQLTEAQKGVRTASNNFGLNTFSQIYAAEAGKDVVFSPLSLSLALAMTAEGAEGETWKQFADVIGWGTASKEEVGSYYKTMISGLVEADRSVLFTSANSFWAAKDLTLHAGFVKLLKEYFGAEDYSVEFGAPDTVNQINHWCSDKTDGKIPKMLDSTSPGTRLMLINALLFKAPWSFTWEIKKNRTFHGAKGNSKKDFLHTDYRSMAYGDYDDYEYVGVSYGNGMYVMDIILPKANRTIADILPRLTPGSFRSQPQTSEVELYLPKFSTAYFADDPLIPNALMAQGLTLPFGGLADFSGISDEDLFISHILQKTQIDVTEKGTEFAAVTIVDMKYSGMAPVTPRRVSVDLNRPFLYAIREVSSDTILLLGTLSN